MPTFALTAHSQAAAEDVWKLLHDPTRFPEWWEGVETIASGADGQFTLWPAGYPDFPMAQRLEADHADARITISCLVSDLVFCWQLHDAGETTDIEVTVEIPDHEAHRLPEQRRLLEQSLRSLAALAAEAS